MAGIFPFLETGELRNRSGDVLVAELGLTRYDQGGFTSTSGQKYESVAYASEKCAEHTIGKSNVRLIVGDDQFTVVGAIHHKHVHQVELQLTRNLAA